MAHSNGRIYIDTSVTPNVGVDLVGDVAYVLGTGSGYLEDNCTAAAIKQWAKYRPIEKAGYVQRLTDAMRKAEDWGIGNIPQWSSKTLANMVNFWAKGNTSSANLPDIGLKVEWWTKVLPSTNNRLLDFAADVGMKGYRHSAEAPIAQLSGSLEISLSGQLDVIYTPGVANDETLSFADFRSWKDFYFGVVFAKSNASTIYIVTQDVTVENATDFTLHIPSADALEGTWLVFPILSSAEISTLSSAQNNTVATWVALLESVSKAVTLRKVDYTLLADYASRDERTIDYKFSLRNNETNTSLSQVSLVITFIDSLGNVLATQSKSVALVAAQSTAAVTGSYAFSSASGAQQCYSVLATVSSMLPSRFDPQTVEAIVGDLPTV